MSTSNLERAAVGVAAAGASAAENNTAVDELIAKIRDESDQVRADAWTNAGDVGAPAVKPLAAVMTDDALEVARAAKRAVWKIVRHSGRPGADAERTAVVDELIALLADAQPGSVRREVLWMLSEIGGDEAVDPIVPLLSNEELRENARMALERIPVQKSIEALKAGIDAAPKDFKLNIAQSLRKRGIKVPGLPCAKLTPAKQTHVKPYTPPEAKDEKE